MYREQPVILQFSLAVAAINMILSSLVIIGLPVIITQMLGFDSETANRFYGYAESIFAMGSLCGGMGGGLFAKKTKAKNGYLLLLYDALTLIPIGIAIMITMQTMISYFIILVSCFFHGIPVHFIFYSDYVLSADDRTCRFDRKGNILCYVYRNVCITDWAGNVWRFVRGLWEEGICLVFCCCIVDGDSGGIYEKSIYKIGKIAEWSGCKSLSEYLTITN